jgi:hypothetical protein
MSKIAKEAKVGVNLGKQDTLSVSGQNGELCRLLACLNDRTITSTLPGTIRNDIDDDKYTRIDWTMVDPDEDPTYQEILLYSTSYHCLKQWQYFMADNLPIGTCKDEYGIIYIMMDTLPHENKLLDETFIPPIKHFYYTAYTTVSSSSEDMRNRRAMLTQFRALLRKMSEYKQIFTEALPLARRDRLGILYARVVNSFNEWSARAEFQFSAIHRREERGRRQ